MSAEFYERNRLEARRAQAEAVTRIDNLERRRAEVTARLDALRGAELHDPARGLQARRRAVAAATNLQVARDRDRRAHERAARAHDAAARLHDNAAGVSSAQGDHAAACLHRAAGVRERHAAAEDRRAAHLLIRA